jgi:hypothetical protein
MPTFLLASSLLRRVADVPLLYLLLWCGLVSLSGLLVVLMRSRWGRSKTLHKCAVLSLLVHVLLACLAMTVRIVVGDGGTSTGPPIRVRLIEESPAPPQVAMLTPPPLLEPEPAEEIEPLAEETQAEEQADQPLVASAEPPAPETDVDPFEVVESQPQPPPPDVTTEEVADDVVTDAETVEADNTELVAADPSVTPVPEAAPAETAASAEPPMPPSIVAVAVPAAPTPYAHRTSTDRLEIVEQQGGSRDTEAAVVAALDWLAAAQSADGRWDASRFEAGREQVVLGQDRHGAGSNADTGISALALLAFLGAGHTHLEGNYRPTVRSGLEFLLRSQAADGNLSGPSELFARMYCHAMATFALGEAQAMSGDKRLEPGLRRAVAYSVRAQHPSTGGWRYRVGDTGDTSQLGWQMMSLWSAQQAGVEISPQTWTGVERFLRSVRRGRHGGLASYRADGPASTSMTAEALYCRLLLDETIGGGLDERSAGEATESLLANRPTSDRVNLYYWYYGTLALHHRQYSSPQAEDAWFAWNSDLTNVLLRAQADSGPETGSWSPNTIWGGYGGRVYTTAMAALCLEVYYRYAPTTPRDQWIATRPGEAETVQ